MRELYPWLSEISGRRLPESKFWNT